MPFVDDSFRIMRTQMEGMNANKGKRIKDNECVKIKLEDKQQECHFFYFYGVKQTSPHTHALSHRNRMHTRRRRVKKERLIRYK